MEAAGEETDGINGTGGQRLLGGGGRKNAGGKSESNVAGRRVIVLLPGQRVVISLHPLESGRIPRGSFLSTSPSLFSYSYDGRTSMRFTQRKEEEGGICQF